MPVLADKQPYIQSEFIKYKLRTLVGLLLNHTCKKPAHVSTTLHMDLLLCQHWWHLPQPSAGCMEESICMTACLQTLPDPHISISIFSISIINAVNPDLGKKKKKKLRRKTRRNRDTYIYAFPPWNTKAYSDLSCL